jgi:hypothetical protein
MIFNNQINVLKKTTITVTFRIVSHIMRQMKEKAEQDGIALNTPVWIEICMSKTEQGLIRSRDQLRTNYLID